MFLQRTSATTSLLEYQHAGLLSDLPLALQLVHDRQISAGAYVAVLSRHSLLKGKNASYLIS